MPPKPQGDRAMTNAERQARLRERVARQRGEWLASFALILNAKTLCEAREIAEAALATKESEE